MRILTSIFAIASLTGPLLAIAQAPGGYENFHGTWQGPVEFTVSEGPDQTTTGTGSIKVTPNGELAGSSDTGCKFTGTARQVSASAPTNGILSVTTTGCKDARFNIEFTGTLAVSSTSRTAFYTITPAETGVAGRPTIRGTFTH